MSVYLADDPECILGETREKFASVWLRKRGSEILKIVLFLG